MASVLTNIIGVTDMSTKKSWVSKKNLKKTLMSLEWNPYASDLFGIVQELKDTSYYMRHTQMLLGQMCQGKINAKDLDTCIRLLLLTKIAYEEPSREATYCSKKLPKKIAISEMPVPVVDK